MSTAEKILNYEDILQKFNMSQLTEICRKFDFSGYSKLKKAEMVEFIKERVFDKSFFEKIIISMHQKDLAYLRDKDSDVQGYDCVDLAKYSFVMIDTKTLKVHTAGDIKDFCNEIFTAEFEEKYNFYRDIITYQRALAELWGIVPVDKFIEVYNAQNNASITAEDVKNAVDCNKYATDCYYFYNEETNELIHESLRQYEGDDIQRLKNHQKNKPFYIPDKMQLIRYSDANYFDRNMFFDDLENCIENNCNCDYSVAHTLAEEICLMAKMNCAFNDIMYYIESMGIEMKDKSTYDKLQQRYSRVYQNSRLWEHRGHTTEEMKTLKDKTKTAANISVNHKKIGRNDPCPCGSGKKYKKCCGK